MGLPWAPPGDPRPLPPGRLCSRCYVVREYLAQALRPTPAAPGVWGRGGGSQKDGPRRRPSAAPSSVARSITRLPPGAGLLGVLQPANPPTTHPSV